MAFPPPCVGHAAIRPPNAACVAGAFTVQSNIHTKAYDLATRAGLLTVLRSALQPLSLCAPATAACAAMIASCQVVEKPPWLDPLVRPSWPPVEWACPPLSLG